MALKYLCYYSFRFSRIVWCHNFSNEKNYCPIKKDSCFGNFFYGAKNYFKKNKVFLKDEQTAIKAGYRPCGVCMNKEYKEWKNKQLNLIKKH